MIDSPEFSSETFDVKAWINKTLVQQQQLYQQQQQQQQQPENGPFDASEAASNLVVKLQLAMQDVTVSLEETGQQIIQAIPRVLRDVDTIKVEAVALKERMASVGEDLKTVEKNTGESMKALVEIDSIRDRMEAATIGLRQAGTWATLASEADNLIASGDISKVRDHLHEMRLCLASMGLASHWSQENATNSNNNNNTSTSNSNSNNNSESSSLEQKRELLRNCENKFEARLAPKLFHALNNREEAEAKLYLDCFEQMGRQNQFESYFARCHAASVHRLWKSFHSSTATATATATGSQQLPATTNPNSTSAATFTKVRPMTEWYPQFLDEVSSVVRSEILWCTKVFPIQRAIQFVSSLVMYIFSGLANPTLPEAISTHILVNTSSSSTSTTAPSQVSDLLVLLRLTNNISKELATAFSNAIQQHHSSPSSSGGSSNNNNNSNNSNSNSNSNSNGNGNNSGALSNSSSNTSLTFDIAYSSATSAAAAVLPIETQKEISKLLYAPFDRFRREANTFEHQFMMSQLNSLMKLDPPTASGYMDHIRVLAQLIPKVFNIPGKSIARIVELTQGGGVPEFAKTVTSFIIALTTKISTVISQYRAVCKLDSVTITSKPAGGANTSTSTTSTNASAGGSSSTSSEIDEEWGVFQGAVGILQICGDILEKISALDNALVFAALDNLPSLLESFTENTAFRTAHPPATPTGANNNNNNNNNNNKSMTPNSSSELISFQRHSYISQQQFSELSAWLNELIARVKRVKSSSLSPPVSSTSFNNATSTAATPSSPLASNNENTPLTNNNNNNILTLQILGNALAEAVSVTTRAHAYALDSIFIYVDQRLSKLKTMSFVSKAMGNNLEHESLSSSQPVFSLSPLEYITQIGEHLLTLPHQLEPFVVDENRTLTLALAHGKMPEIYQNALQLTKTQSAGAGASEEDSYAHRWMTAVALVTMNTLAKRLLEIPKLSGADIRQILTDIDYLCNVLAALDVAPTPTLSYVKQLLQAPPEKYKSLAGEKPAGCDINVFNRIAALRDIPL